MTALPALPQSFQMAFLQVNCGTARVFEKLTLENVSTTRTSEHDKHDIHGRLMSCCWGACESCTCETSCTSNVMDCPSNACLDCIPTQPGEKIGQKDERDNLHGVADGRERTEAFLGLGVRSGGRTDSGHRGELRPPPEGSCELSPQNRPC